MLFIHGLAICQYGANMDLKTFVSLSHEALYYDTHRSYIHPLNTIHNVEELRRSKHHDPQSEIIDLIWKWIFFVFSHGESNLQVI